MSNISLVEFGWGMGLTLFAGMATAIGSCVAFFFKRTNFKVLSFLLGFSGGVMVYISLVEMLASARNDLIGHYGHTYGSLSAIAAFLGGILFTLIIDRLIPEYENPHEVQSIESMEQPVNKKRLMRSGLFFSLAIAIHNLPEGMAVFVSSLEKPSAAIAIAFAIAIHNIPEGITVSVPIYQATGSRKKAFVGSALSGFAEPLGALIAYLVLLPFLTGVTLPLIFASVAGIMVFISFDELLPLSEKYGEHHLSIYGLISGMLVMALSLSISFSG